MSDKHLPLDFESIIKFSMTRHLFPVIKKIVNTWPTAIDGQRATDLGLPVDESPEQVIHDYIEDFL